MPKVTYSEVSCPDCTNYQTCKTIETRYAETLAGNGGNWRALFENGKRVATPIRRCALTWTAQQLGDFTNGNMLEIGCGASMEIGKRFCKERNIQYVGVDESLPFHGINALPCHGLQQKFLLGAFKLFNVRKLYKVNPNQRYVRDLFPSRHLEGCKFNIIYGNSTIEHWHEKELDLQKSMQQYKDDIKRCHEMLNDGGKLLLSCPIFVHGNYIFMHGHVDMVEEIFSGNWSSVSFESWRKSYGDLAPYCPQARRDDFKQRFGIDLQNIYLVNVVAVK